MTTIHTIRRPFRTTLAALAIAAVPLTAFALPTVADSTATTATAAATTTACPKGWGSLPEASNRVSTATLRNVRTGRHACFDRLVVDLAGPRTGYRVEYVSAVTQDGSGFVVPLRGGAKLQIIVVAPAYDDAGRPTYRPANQRELTNVAGYRTFRQVAWAGSFEGQSTIGLGVRARLPFRTFTLTGPGTGSRLVIDVAHTW
jgi:hypothetical protein